MKKLINNTLLKLSLIALFISLSFVQSKMEKTQEAKMIMEMQTEEIVIPYDYFVLEYPIIDSKLEILAAENSNDMIN